MGEWSGTRLYLGNLPPGTREKDIEDFFNEHGHGEITEIKLMDTFGFIQYSSADDAKDIVPAFHGRDFRGKTLIVQFARGHRHGPREYGASGTAFPPRPRRTQFKMTISGLPPDTSWQDLKDFARRGSDNVVYSDISRDRNGQGVVDFETDEDLKRAVSLLDGQEYRGVRVQCVADDTPASATSVNGQPTSRPYNSYSHGPRGRSRSPYRGGSGGYRGRYSPPQRGGYSPPPPRSYGRERGGYGESPPHGSGYRERSPRGRRDPYYSGGGRERSPPRRAAPPADDYPPPRSYSNREDPYPPRRGGYDDEPYHGGHSQPRRGGYDEQPQRGGRYPSPGPRGRTPPRGQPPPRGYDDYDRRRY